MFSKKDIYSKSVLKKFMVCLFLLAIAVLFSHLPKIKASFNLNKDCLKCHAIKGREPKILMSGEKMYLYVDEKRFSQSVHGKMPCIVCHTDINIKTHPRPVKISSLKDYRKKIAKRCLVCHPPNKLSPFHKDILTYRKDVTCVECHGSHYIKSHKQMKELTKDCLRCHAIKGREPKILMSGEKMYLYVNEEKFLKSPHGELGCLACHYDVDPQNHPYVRQIKSFREYSKSINKRCLVCHPVQTISKHKGHAKVVRTGILCTTCHSPHTLTKISEWEKKLSYNDYCLTCHRFSFKKKFKDGTIFTLRKVSLKEIHNSVHSRFQCVFCHRDFSKTKHPTYTFKNKQEYMKFYSERVCKSCHNDAFLKRNPAHYALTKQFACVECHGSHGVQPIKAQMQALSEKAYCLSCHSRDIKKTFESGETISLKVDTQQLIHSVHKDLKCSDCHVGYSKEAHPIYTYKSLKDFRAKGNEICAKCHNKEMQEYHQSIHFAEWKKGIPLAPDCLKCHGYHDVQKIVGNKELSIKTCAMCHTKEFKTFETGIHAKNNVTCVECHNTHAIKSVAMINLNKSCFKCHENMVKVHLKWLNNPPFAMKSFVELHFNKIDCAVCHAPAKKEVLLKFVDSNNKKVAIEKAYISKFDANRNNKLEQQEFWALVKDFKSKHPDILIEGKLTLVDRNNAHLITSKEKYALRKCASCHNPAADFEVSLDDQIKVEKAVLNSVSTILNMRNFYVIGLTKIQVLDIIFVLAVLAGLGFAFGHIALRIITRPIRKKRKGGE